MSRPHFRPRLVLLVDEERERVRAVLERRLAAAAPRMEGRLTSASLLAWIAPPERRFWSPCLDVNLRDHPRGTLVVGRFGPHPALMTAYVFASIGLGFFGSIALVWAYVQHTLGEPPMCLLGALVAALAGAALWGTSRLGFGWGREQALALAQLVEGLGEVRDDEAAALLEADGHRWSGADDPQPETGPE